MFKGTAIALVLLAASGCTPSVWVTERAADGGPLVHRPGVPFRVKKVVFRQTTTYEQQLRRVSLVGDKDGTRAIYASCIVEVEPANEQTLRELKDKAGASKDHGVLRPIFDRLNPANLTGSKHATLIGNTVSRELVIDEERELFLNAPLPWFGSSSLTTKLAQDGTLTEIAVEAKSEPEAVAELLPLAEVLTPARTAEERLIVDLEIEPIIVHHILAWEWPERPAALSPLPLPESCETTPREYRRIQVTGSSGGTKAPKRPTVDFSGSIVLPKD